MATRRKTAASTAAAIDAGSSDDELIPGDVADDSPTIEQQIDEFFGEAHGDVKCSIYELGGTRHDQRGFLFSFPFTRGYSAAELYEQLLESHGPGWYELSAQATGGRGWVKRKIFQLGSERDRMRAAMRKADPTEPAPSVTAQPAQSSALSPELRALLEGQQRILEHLATRPERDTLTVAKELAELRGLFGDNDRKPTPIGEIMGIVKEVLALKNELADDEGRGSDSPLVAALRQFGPAINAAVERLGGEPAPAAAPMPAGPGTAPAAGPGTTAPGGAQLNGQNGGGSGLMDINLLFADLHRRAESDEQPAAVADAVLVYLADRPEWVEAAILSMVIDERERVVNRIIGSYPKLAAHREWLGRVVKELLTQIESDAAANDDDDDTGSGAEAEQPQQVQASAGGS